MTTSFTRTTASVLMLLLSAAAAAQPTITSINAGDRARSGRVSLVGSGFGAGGDVVIAGLEALQTTWTSTRIVAYVPEAAPIGATTLVVVAGGQTSNAVPLNVTERTSHGVVRWTFEADGQDLMWRPALAPDGTIYHGRRPRRAARRVGAVRVVMRAGV